MKNLIKQLGNQSTEIIIGLLVSASLVAIISLLAGKWGDAGFIVATLLLFVAFISAFQLGKARD